MNGNNFAGIIGQFKDLLEDLRKTGRFFTKILKMITDEELKERVRNLMYQNIKEGYSKLLKAHYSYIMPSPQRYPFQWWWDTCFNIFILCSLGEIELAKKNLTSLFAMQQENGYVGHMIFWESVLPKDKLNILQARPTIHQFRPHMSALIQPPLVAHSLWRIYESSGDIDFVGKMLPGLIKYFEWLKAVRDMDGDGLISIISPFESGIDWKPSFDEVIGRKQAKATEILFWKVIMVDVKNFLRRYNLNEIYKSNYFLVKEVMVNTMYALDLRYLAKLCKTVGNKSEIIYEERARRIVQRMEELMYNEEKAAFFDVYGKENIQSRTLTFTITIPLLLNIVNEQVAKKMITRHLLNSSEFALPFPIPSTSKSEPSFYPKESKFLWRGPTWVAINWFMAPCLRNYGFVKESDQLIEKTIWLIEKSGFREYYDPFTGEGYGAKDFTWGGLVIDMIRQREEFRQKVIMEKEIK